jgi:arylsulfatase A
MIKAMDEGIGNVLTALDEEGLRQNTIVVFTSDNGPQFGCGDDDWRQDRFNCGFRGSKGSVHEGGIRVPLLMRWPDGLEGGRHYHDLVHFVDWMPTLMAAAGIGVPGDLHLDGQNVLPALRGEGRQKLNPKRFWQWSRGVPVATHNAAMRDGDWKLVRPGDVLANTFPGWERDLKLYADVDLNPERYLDGVPEATGRAPCQGVAPEPALLFNLAADPLETTDLCGSHPAVASRMLSELENWFDDVERDRRTITDKPYRCPENMAGGSS